MACRLHCSDTDNWGFKMHMRRSGDPTCGNYLFSLALSAGVVLCPAAADAVQSHGHHPGLQFASPVAGHHEARLTRMTHYGTAPRQMSRAWRAFQADAGGQWRASWDDATLVPNRIWGSGIDAPLSNADPAAAERFARAMMTRHIDLLAPGSTAGDFELVSNRQQNGLRIVGFLQHKAGLRVIGGQLSFRFKNNRLVMLSSQALPHVSTPHLSMPAGSLSPAAARQLAQTWIAKDGATQLTAKKLEGPVILPLVAHGRVLAYRTALRVRIESRSPAGQWWVYLDANTGERVAREQTLRFAEAEIHYNAPERYPLSDRKDYPAREAKLKLGGNNITTTTTGTFDIPDGETLPLNTGVEGSRVKVDNKKGSEAAQTFDMTGGDLAVWKVSDNEQLDSQLSAFVHTQIAQQHALAISPNMSFAKAQLRVNVNIDDECNAFYNGQSINFFSSSKNCANTGRLADVVYHEFGHGFHHHSAEPGAGELDKATGEGVADYFSSSLTNDPGMGRGFFHSSKPLRHIDPDNFEHVWPEHIHSDPHQTGLIIAGALWDLRKLLIEKYGDEQGSSLSNTLYADALRGTTDIPSMYPEMLVADDDDGDLTNGTPHVCEINRAFGMHGLRAITVTSDTPDIEPPRIENGADGGHDVQIHIDGLFEQCPDDAIDIARIEWRLRRNPNQISAITMQGGPIDYQGVIPQQDEGEVVLYKVNLEIKGGSTMFFPNNRADTMYQFFVGEVVPLYCTDFENDPLLEGWTHQLVKGEQNEGADDWQWDVPMGNGQNGDPPAAYSGERVLGNDLGHGNFNGLYQGNKTNVALSPMIDTSGYSNIRLQYRRWLNVEDGFFDQARIYANGVPMWTNFASNSEHDAKVHHRDREWRFQDIDLSKAIVDDQVQVIFEIASDQGFNLGGWTIDDFCVVAYEGSFPTDSKCGNGEIDVGEQCDDGNTVGGDGCDSFCGDENDDDDVGVDADGESMGTVVIQGCGCHVVGSPQKRGETPWPLAFGLLGLGALWRRRRLH